jgi:tRNA dimethylallyltransferase
MIQSYSVLQLGIKTDDAVLKERIHVRLIKRVRRGMVAEGKRLHEQGVSWKRLEELGLEYKYLALYLQQKINKEEMLTQLETEIWHFAKRQKTWFKRDPRTQWVSYEEQDKTMQLVGKFLQF